MHWHRSDEATPTDFSRRRGVRASRPPPARRDPSPCAEANGFGAYEGGGRRATSWCRLLAPTEDASS